MDFDDRTFDAQHFVKNTSDWALTSAAINHPYLTALATGDLPDIDAAFRDFARQYGLYSAKFIPYVSAVYERLESVEHREILHENLAEEKGDTHDVVLPPDVLETVTGVPHVLLYRRFQEALGVTPGVDGATDDCPGYLWSQDFLRLCESNQYVGVGAIGIGTEFIVSRVFRQILEGLSSFSSLSMTQRVFFDLHSECDDKHAAEVLSITQDLATDRDAAEQIEYGVKTALSLRATFWDRLLQRALAMPRRDRPGAEGASAVGYQKSL